MGNTHTVINNGEKQKQVKNELVEEYLLKGWKLGRLMPPWNKGLNAGSDARVAKYAKSQKEYYANISLEQRTSINARLHEANIGKKWTAEAIRKRTETRKRNGFTPSEEQRRKVSEKLKGHAVSESTRKKLSQKNKGRQGTPCPEERKKYFSMLHSSPEYQKRQNETKKRNGTLNTSRPEQMAYQLLRKHYGDDVEYSYRDDRYPYNCDFYIKPSDLFIELNLLWTHGGEPFDESNLLHLEKLNMWKLKSQASDFYKNAIYTWTVLDVRKRETAQKNKLNYLTFYKEKDFYTWFEEITAV